MHPVVWIVPFYQGFYNCHHLFSLVSLLCEQYSWAFPVQCWTVTNCIPSLMVLLLPKQWSVAHVQRVRLTAMQFASLRLNAALKHWTNKHWALDVKSFRILVLFYYAHLEIWELLSSFKWLLISLETLYWDFRFRSGIPWQLCISPTPSWPNRSEIFE